MGRDLTPAGTGGKVDITMWNRVAAVLAIIGFGVMMALRSELSSVAARAALAAVACGLFGLALALGARSRAARERRESS